MHYLKRATLAIAVMVGALTVFAPSAFATAPGFERFVGCPNSTDVIVCLRSDTNGGHIQIGSKDVPITRQIVFSGGLSNIDGVTVLYNSQGGLQAPALRIPGGLVGLTGLSEILIDILTLGANQVYAKTELVGTPRAFGALALVLPVRVKLQNPFLTSTCAIGSAATPVTLNLTTQTTNPPLPNRPISGVLGTQSQDPVTPAITLISNSTYVDNAFAAPAATNCGLFGFGVIDALVNLTSGLPSAAGRNTAVQSATNLAVTLKSNVYP